MRRQAAGGAVVAAVLGLLAGPLRADLTQVQRLSPGDLSSGDSFGATVATGGGVIAAGAYLAHGRAGAVYLYRRDGDRWSLFASPALQGGSGDELGFSLAVTANGRTLYAGAPGAAVGGVRCGAVFKAEVDPAGTVGSFTRLTLRDGFCEPGAEIGSSVATGGGLVVIGARGADGRAGRVYACPGAICDRLPAAPSAGDELGQSAATDGVRVVSGAPFTAVAGQPDAGAAYVFTPGGDGGWSVERLDASPAGGSAFGYAVALAGDHIAVGAPLAGGLAGEVRVFRQSAGAWAGGAPVTAGGGPAELGVSLAAAGSRFYSGARWAGGGRGTGSGAVYPLGADPARLGEPLHSSPPAAGGEFGFDLAYGDGVLVVGAFGEAGTGAAYVFSEPVTPPVQQVTVGLKPASVEVAENAGTAAVPVTLTLATSDGQPPATAVTVTLATADGTATAPADYKETGKTVTIQAGETRTEIPESLAIPVVADGLCEGDETFSVRLAVSSGGLLSPLHEEDVVIHDASTALTLSPSPPAHLPTREGGPPVRLDVGLSCPPAFPVTVSLESDSPQGIVDPPMLTFAAGAANQRQTTFVRSIDNTSCGDNPSYKVTAVAASADPRYDGLSVQLTVDDINDDLRCVSGQMRVCAFPDGTVYYAAILRDEGSSQAPADLFDQLPPQVSVISASANRGVATVDFVGNTVAWNGTIPASGEVTVWIVAALAASVSPGDPVGSGEAILTFDRDRRPPLETFLIPPVGFYAFQESCDPAFPF